MTFAAVVAAGLTVWAAAAVIVSLLIGRSIRRADQRLDQELQAIAQHRVQCRPGLAGVADCPPWHVRERAAALLNHQQSQR